MGIGSVGKKAVSKAKDGAKSVAEKTKGKVEQDFKKALGEPGKMSRLMESMAGADMKSVRNVRDNPADPAKGATDAAAKGEMSAVRNVRDGGTASAKDLNPKGAPPMPPVSFGGISDLFKSMSGMNSKAMDIIRSIR